MRSITSLKKLSGKRVLLRVDFNVPIIKGRVADPFRIDKALPTIHYLRTHGAKIILISHLGDDGSATLKPVADYLAKKIGLTFVPEVLGNATNAAISAMHSGDIILLENLRRVKGEKENDPKFARSLASLAEVYVNDAFSVSHRAHASIVGVPKYLPSYAGLQLETEIKNLNLVIKHPAHPFVFILGGAKFETKLPLIKRYLKTADTLFIGGALANQFFKELGYETGKSLVEPKKFGLKSLAKNKKIMLPADVAVLAGRNVRVVLPTAISANENIIDAGPQTLLALADKIKKAKLVLWNGPLGKSTAGYDGATEKLLKLVAKSKAKTIIGGGDTTEIVSKYKMEKQFTFVSTGGGATLDFLAKGTLPGIKALG